MSKFIYPYFVNSPFFILSYSSELSTNNLYRLFLDGITVIDELYNFDFIVYVFFFDVFTGTNRK
jgi:hypothetical protein